MMKKIIIIIYGVFYTLNVFAQQLQIKTPLAKKVQETSGLLNINQKIYTFNDSGNEPILYEIDVNTGQVIQQKYIQNAHNVDWEAISADESFIYIADIGNNKGKRTDLMIYKIAIDSFIQQDTLRADSIAFSYANQTDFTPRNQHNFDAEAIIAFQDSLYIFTKNRENFQSNIYALPKNKGNYSAYQKASLTAVNGLITDAVFNAQNNSILLLGYFFKSPYIYEIKSFVGNDFVSGNHNRSYLQIPNNGSVQTEGICVNENNTYYISAEKFDGKDQVLYNLEKTTVGIQQEWINEIKIYPNPSQKAINIECNQNMTLHSSLYTLIGELVLQEKGTILNVKNIKEGNYLLIIKSNEQVIKAEKIKITH